MKVIKTLKPNAPGAKRFQEQWGDKLIAVRYRKNIDTDSHFTTIEIIVDERKYGASCVSQGKIVINKNSIVAIRTPAWDKETRRKLIQSGAVWHKKEKLWLARYGLVSALGLTGDMLFDANGLFTDINIHDIL